MWIQTFLNTLGMISLFFVFMCCLVYTVIKFMGGSVNVHKLRDKEDYQEYIRQLQERLEEMEQEGDE